MAGPTPSLPKAIVELVIVGYGKPETTTDEDLQILSEEAGRSLVKKQLVNKPMTKYGKEAEVVFSVDFTFKLEE